MKIRALLTAAFLALVARPCPAAEAGTDYAGRVRAYTDAMIEHGRDTVGRIVRSADRYLASEPPSLDNLVAGAMGDVIAN